MDLTSTPAEVALKAMLTYLRVIPGIRTNTGWIQDGVEYYIEEKSKHKDGSIDGFVTRLDTGKAIGSFEIAADGRVKWFPCSGPTEWAAATATAKAKAKTTPLPDYQRVPIDSYQAKPTKEI